MSISKQTEFFLQQMSNGDVLMSVMSISEKNRSPFCSKWSCFDEYDVYFEKGEVVFATNDHVYTSLMSISKQTKSLSPSLRLHCPLTKS
jgi:hypothetical protein